ncbi:MAG TPA: hypothetical protein VEV41_11945 [Terriglobales bacterium]|nr:hypothetical protein [Terriglobales bacterium]
MASRLIRKTREFDLARSVGNNRAAAILCGLPEGLVLYCARHDFGTYVLQKTGNIAAVMNTMGHSDVRTAMVYQHPELNLVREAINARLWHR